MKQIHLPCALRNSTKSFGTEVPQDDAARDGFQIEPLPNTYKFAIWLLCRKMWHATFLIVVAVCATDRLHLLLVGCSNNGFLQYRNASNDQAQIVVRLYDTGNAPSRYVTHLPGYAARQSHSTAANLTVVTPLAISIRYRILIVLTCARFPPSPSSLNTEIVSSSVLRVTR